MNKLYLTLKKQQLPYLKDSFLNSVKAHDKAMKILL